MTQRQRKQYERGIDDCEIGIEHKAGRGKYYDMGYSYSYSMQAAMTQQGHEHE